MIDPCDECAEYERVVCDDDFVHAMAREIAEEERERQRRYAELMQKHGLRRLKPGESVDQRKIEWE